MAAANAMHGLTEAEYLEIERRAEFKSEFLDGEMFAMGGGRSWPSPSRASTHSLIKCNLIRAIGNQLEASPCVVYDSDMRVQVQATRHYIYPDLSVACGEHQWEDEHNDTLLNPVLIAEVLSESSEAYDRGEKFEMYRRLPWLQEYLLINEYEPRIEQYIRQDAGNWLLRDVAGLEGELSLPSVGLTIALAKVYSKVQFAPNPRRPAR